MIHPPAELEMSLLEMRAVEKAFGDRAVLRGCKLLMKTGERIGLVGPNGCGKSTLLSIMAGLQKPDHGSVIRNGSVGILTQNPRLKGETVGQVVDAALAWHGRLLAAYHQALARGDMSRAAKLHDRLDVAGWDLSHHADAMLHRLGAPSRATPIAQLSGGELRRVALARTLLGSPELLLLDEPTNHLDVDTGEWLQAYLRGYRGGVVLVTHDRYLIEAVVDRIVEIDDGVCISYDGSYGDYLLARAERRAAQERAEDHRLALIAREAAWAARSPAARTTRAKSRLRRLDQLRSRRTLASPGKIDIQLHSGQRLGQNLVEASGLGKSYGNRTLFRQVDFTLKRGERLGLIGPNGAGKSTLLEIIAGLRSPDMGKIYRAPRVKLSLFDQQRSGLDPADTVFHAAGNGNSHVSLGDRSVHVSSFLKNFLFSHEMLDQRVAQLSGGERARLLLARLLLEGSHVLLLDEPTNDLDLQTLRVLEEALMGFDGATIVATHDRAFLDRVCTGILAFHADARLVAYASRQQYHGSARASRDPAGLQRPRAASRSKASGPTSARLRPRKPRRSYHQEREYQAIPQHIEDLENQQAAVEARLAEPSTYRDPHADPAALTRRLAQLTQQIEALYQRWTELEELES